MPSFLFDAHVWPQSICLVPKFRQTRARSYVVVTDLCNLCLIQSLTRDFGAYLPRAETCSDEIACSISSHVFWVHHQLILASCGTGAVHGKGKLCSSFGSDQNRVVPDERGNVAVGIRKCRNSHKPVLLVDSNKLEGTETGKLP
jgi:secreted trypsin-like serine protease